MSDELRKRAEEIVFMTPASKQVDAIVDFAAEQVSAEREAIIAAIPGGNIVDPQWVCDMIRQREKK